MAKPADCTEYASPSTSATLASASAVELVPTNFRLPLPMRLRLEAIQHEKGHGHLTDTLREAVELYVADHERKRVA